MDVIEQAMLNKIIFINVLNKRLKNKCLCPFTSYFRHFLFDNLNLKEYKAKSFWEPIRTLEPASPVSVVFKADESH